MKSFTFLFFVSFSFTLYSCHTDELSLSHAEHLLKKRLSYPREMPYMECITRQRTFRNAINGLQLLHYQKYFESLEKEGLLTFDTTGTTDSDSIVFQAQLTERGKSYMVEGTENEIKSIGHHSVKVEAGSFIFGKIRSLTQWKEQKMAKADFIELTDLTPFGKNGEYDKVYYRTAIFIKKEDGWRIFSLTENSFEKKVWKQRQAREAILQPLVREPDPDIYYVVVAATGNDFDSLRHIASDVAALLHSKVDMLDRVYKPNKGIIIPEDFKEELFRGVLNPRWPDGDQNFVSIEMLMNYEENIDASQIDTLKMCVVANILKKKPAADSIFYLLKDEIKTVQVLKRFIYYQCGI